MIWTLDIYLACLACIIHLVDIAPELDEDR